MGHSLRQTRQEMSNWSAWIYSLLIFIAIGEEYLVQVMFHTVLARLPLISIEGLPVMYACFGVLYLIKLPEIIKNLIRKKAWDVLGVSVLVIVSVCVLCTVNKEYLEHTNVQPVKIILFYLPIYGLARSLSSFDKIVEKLPIYAYIALAFVLLLIAKGDSTEAIQQGYETHMTRGYVLSLCALIFYDHYLAASKSRRIIHYVSLSAGVVASILTMLQGSRGATVVILVYFLYVVLKKYRTAKTWKKIMLILLLGLFVVGREILKDTLVDVLQIDKESSRTLAWLFGLNDNLDTSGRDLIYHDAFIKIFERPLLGWGLACDYKAIGTIYVHNLFLEWMLDFGLILGGFFTINYVIRLFRTLNSEEVGRMASVVGIYITGQLMVSNSYLLIGTFWLVLGMIMSQPLSRRIRFV